MEVAGQDVLSQIPESNAFHHCHQHFTQTNPAEAC